MYRSWVITVIIGGILLFLVGVGVVSSFTMNSTSNSDPLDRGSWLYVGGSGSGNYTTIQSAINAASSGDTVFVYNGTYYENVIVNKTINLIGENRDTTIIDGGGTGDVVYVSANWVNISGFGITHSGGTPWEDAGIDIESNFNTITDNTVSNNTLGIRLGGSKNTVIGNNALINHVGICSWYSSYNAITGNNVYGISNNDSGGIILYCSSNNTVTGNNLHLISLNHSPGAIMLFFSSYNVITGNNVSSSSCHGIYIDRSNNLIITGNNVLDNYGGIFAHGSSNIAITGNNVNANKYSGIVVEEGYLSYCTNITITGNNANSNNDTGIDVYGSNIIVRGNNASNNKYGIFLYSSNFTITDNTISNNKYGIYLYVSSNNTMAGNDVNSNYYSIILYSSNNNTITDNNASNNKYGIYLYKFSNSNIFTDNNVSNNDYGIHLDNSSYNIIYNNYFSNLNNVYDNRNNIWNITKTPGTSIIGGPYLGGNYWSNYTGADIDGDGLGDTNIPYGPGDYLPLTSSVGITLYYPINAGWNLITVPVNIPGFKASTLKANITGCQFISKFDSAAQTFWTYTGNPASDYPILDGHGYLVYTTTDRILSLTGTPITTINVTLNVGWNVIGWFNQSSTTASSLKQNITGCQFISKFDTLAQSFWTYTGNPASDYVVSQGMGLMLYTTEASVWHGEG